MGVAYAPFGEDDHLVVTPQKRRVPVVRRERVGILAGPDATECNYLVMFFIFGTFLLVLLQ